MLFDGHPLSTRKRGVLVPPQALLKDSGYHLYHSQGGWGDGAADFMAQWEKRRALHEGKPYTPPKQPGSSYTRARVVEAVEAWDGSKPLAVSWAPGRPFHDLFAREDRVAAQKGRFDAGPQAMAEETYRRQVRMGLYPDNAGWVNPFPPLLDMHKAGLRVAIYPADKEIDFYFTARPYYRKATTAEEPMESYAAAIVEIDDTVGKIVGHLKKKNQYENTLFIITSNSGASGHHECHGVVWATAGATPFVGESRRPEAGGRIAPLILAWPARTKAGVRGSIVKTVVNSHDLAPTLLAAAGVAHPKKAPDGEDVEPQLGRSLLPALAGELQPADKPFVTAERQSWRGVFSDRWSAWGPLSKDPKDAKGWKLFELEKDPVERRDVAAKHPEVVGQMLTHYAAWESTVPLLRPVDWSVYGQKWVEKAKEQNGGK